MRLRIAAVVLAVAVPAWAADPKPPENLPRYDLAVDLDVDGHTVNVAQQVRWTNTSKVPVPAILFNVHSRFQPPKNREEELLYARLLEIFRLPFREAIYKDRAFELGKVELLTRQGDDWKRTELPTQWNEKLDTALQVPLPEPLAPGASVALELNYTIKLPQRQGRWGQWKGVTFLSNWTPVVAFFDAEKGWLPTPFVPYHQPFFNEAGVWTAQVRLPKGEQVASTGSVSRVVEGETTDEVHIGPVTARDFALLTSKRYRTFATEAVVGDRKVVVKCQAFPEHEHYANVLIKHAAKAVATYSKWIGPYPYPELTIAESYFGWNGNECSGLVMIDQRVFAMPKLAEGYVQYLITHEVGHQWFYNTVGTDGYRETFMDEAIVTYLAHRVIDGIEGKNNELLNYPPRLSFLPGIQRENYRFSQFYNTLKNGDLMPPVQDMEKYGDVVKLFAAVYDRGSKVVGIIEDRLGPVAFEEFLRRCYTKYYFRVWRTGDFQKELEEYTGRKWDTFLNDWLKTPGMSDWAVDGVTQNGNTATVILSQRAELSEKTELGFSFDGGETYAHRVPVSMPPKDQEGLAPVPGAEGVRAERIDDKRMRIEVDLPGVPDQVSVDPDKILPDSDPANNHWKPPVRMRPRPLYTFLDETGFTNDYDKWNLIYGPFFYGATYGDAWFTRSTILGLRGGAYRLEEFRGGVYAGFRPEFGDVAVGFDALLPHFPDKKWEVGVHGEATVARAFGRDEYRPDRGVAYIRQNIDPTASLYLYPREYREAYVAYQRNWLPPPRDKWLVGTDIDPLTTLGLHYRKDTLIPYWNPETGYTLDGNVALGLPCFGETTLTGLSWGQATQVWSLPEGMGWLSDVKLVGRAFGGVAFPKDARLFTLGGGNLFRGFDAAERQGSCVWIGSLELRIPLKQEVDFDVADSILRLKSLWLAPFYDVGDIYLDKKSFGPVAHAFGIGVRADIAFFSFLERATLRLDIAQPVRSTNGATQIWFGLQQPF